MSMDKVAGIKPARKALATAGGNIKTRAKAVREGLAALEAEDEIVDIGYRGAKQGIIDDRAELAHEGTQLVAALGRALAEDEVEQTTPEGEVPAPDTEVVVETPEGDETQEQHVHVHTNVFITFINWVRGFTLLQWVLAVIGMLVGLRIGLVTDDFGDATGTARTVIQVVWVTGLTILGFGLGGWIGSLIERRRNNGH